MRYKLVIFDFDGTLANTLPWAIGVANDIADQCSFKRIEKDEEDTLRLYDADQLRKHLGVPLRKLPMIARRFREAMARDIDHITLFEGITQVLSDLSQQGILLAVISSNSLDNIRQVLGEDNAMRIRYYECGVSLLGKSYRIMKVLQRSRVRPAEAIFIGDEIRDSDAAQKACVAFGAVGWGFARMEALMTRSPKAVFIRPCDIIQAMSRNAQADDQDKTV